jgi:hypothetical protein
VTLMLSAVPHLLLSVNTLYDSGILEIGADFAFAGAHL